MTDLSSVQTMGELRAVLKELQTRQNLSYADLTKAAAAAGEVLESSTLSDLFGKRCAISERKLRILLHALNVPDADAPDWVDVWWRTRGSSPPPGVKGFFSDLINYHTALFAGREEETSRIQNFVTNREAGYVFVEALSGYGKTSLLANLVKQNREFRYHFISQVNSRPGAGFDSTRRTDILDSLCEQLNPGHLRGSDTRSLEEEFVSLMGRPYAAKTVIVLDGIDELGPRDKLVGLMQKRLPTGLVIILSARVKGDGSYLPDVGLSASDIGLRLRLPGLDTPAIVSLLEKVGGAATPLARNPHFVECLNAVSDGDPFYLRFLVEDIANATLTAENIGQVPSGLESYLDLQFKMLTRSVHRPEHVRVFSLLLEADALSRTDLIWLVPGLDSFNFDDVIGEIHRFLLVYEGHYRFCHDRFRAYFRVKTGLD